MNGRPKTVLCEALSEEDAAAFDAFAAANPRAAYQQSRAWAENAPRGRRHRFLYFLCREGGAVIGAAIVRRTRLAPGAILATVQRGPLVRDLSDLPRVVEALGQALEAQGCCTLILGPRFTGEERAAAQTALAGLRFKPLPAEAQALHGVTGIVPLDAYESALFARFKQRGRRAIRKAEQAGLVVREAREADLAACQSLLDAFHQARPGYDSSGQLDILAQIRMVAALGGALLVAEHEGRIVGWHSFVRQGGSGIWLGLATDDDPRLPRSYLLLWEAVRRCRAMGLSRYDLAGLAAEGAESGRDQFKTAFDPGREHLLPAVVRALKPLRHALFFTARTLYRRLRARQRR
jgi:lipid II:glycine glycyltransferase (peptidoglycan interpeptide bridge formation enzyme)